MLWLSLVTDLVLGFQLCSLAADFPSLQRNQLRLGSSLPEKSCILFSIYFPKINTSVCFPFLTECLIYPSLNQLITLSIDPICIQSWSSSSQAPTGVTHGRDREASWVNTEWVFCDETRFEILSRRCQSLLLETWFPHGYCLDVSVCILSHSSQPKQCQLSREIVLGPSC